MLSFLFAGILLPNHHIVTVLAKPPPLNQSALPYDLVMPQLVNKTVKDKPDYFGADISKNTCWVGGFSMESCCKLYDLNLQIDISSRA